MSRVPFFSDYPGTDPLHTQIEGPHPVAGDRFSDQTDDLFYSPGFDSVDIPNGLLPLVDLNLPPPEEPDLDLNLPPPEEPDLASDDTWSSLEEVVASFEMVIEWWARARARARGELWEDTELAYEEFPWGEAPVRRSVAVGEIPVVTVEAAEMARGVNCCAVCVEDYTEGERVSRLPCGHCFHKDCISPWFKTRVTCPICRFKLV